MESKLKHLNTKKASGHDKISNKIIYYLLPSLTSILLTLYTILILRDYFLMIWKRDMGLMILKPNKKKSDPDSFRPIFLLCNHGKVLTSIITTRFYLCAENNNLLPPDQSGFRKNRPTNDRLFQLTQIVAQQFARRNSQHVFLGESTIQRGRCLISVTKYYVMISTVLERLECNLPRC
jgi:hypothetical protein